jgi:hypothetical protein
MQALFHEQWAVHKHRHPLANDPGVRLLLLLGAITGSMQQVVTRRNNCGCTDHLTAMRHKAGHTPAAVIIAGAFSSFLVQSTFFSRAAFLLHLLLFSKKVRHSCPESVCATMEGAHACETLSHLCRTVHGVQEWHARTLAMHAQRGDKTAQAGKALSGVEIPQALLRSAGGCLLILVLRRR